MTPITHRFPPELNRDVICEDEGGTTMEYTCISADCHVDLIWLPPDLFHGECQRANEGTDAYVEADVEGARWVSRSGADFGLVNGMGSAGREYVPGAIQPL